MQSTNGYDANGHVVSEPSQEARELMRAVRGYLGEDGVGLVESALWFATECHEGQLRDSGEPYITHPIAVTAELAKFKPPADVLAAGLLHDTVEDCDVTTEQVESRFGKNVAEMVDGVTKLAEIDAISDQVDPERGKRRHGANRDRRRMATMRKMVVFGANNPRVLQIKLCDKMHNVSTLEHMKDERKRLQKAREALEIYAPLADRLGMNDIKWRMEDAAFRVLDPETYQTTSRLVSRKRRDRERYVKLAERLLQDAIANAGIVAMISGRAKHLYSVYRKKKKYEREGKTFHEIHDLIALRVITEHDNDCYLALSAVHGLWPMVQGEFDDYVSRPKKNGYQSIHTTVLGPRNMPLEVQIRSESMHEVAEVGMAAHGAYKEGTNGLPKDGDEAWTSAVVASLRELNEGDGATDDLEEFTDNFKETISQQDKIQVSTPAGEFIDLPDGATALDFAYKVHTEIGHRAVGATVNGKMVRLDTKLKPRDTVKISVSNQPKGPSLDWRDPNAGYLITAHALSKVRQWFGRLPRDEKIKLGKQQLSEVLKRLKSLGHNLSEKEVGDILRYASIEELHLDLGQSDLQVSVVVDRAVRVLGQPADESVDSVPKDIERQSKEIEKRIRKSGHGIVAAGQTGLKYNMPKCCSPLYGDDIIGYQTRGKGITAHVVTCSNAVNTKEPERLIELDWGHRENPLPARVIVEGSDRVGFMHDITGILKESKLNLHEMRSGEQSEAGKSKLEFTIYVASIAELALLFAKLDKVKGVGAVYRIS